MSLLVDLSRDILEPSAVRIVDRSVWERLRAVGVCRSGLTLIVAMADPEDAAARKEIEIRTGLTVYAARAEEDVILDALDRSY